MNLSYEDQKIWLEWIQYIIGLCQRFLSLFSNLHLFLAIKLWYILRFFDGQIKKHHIDDNKKKYTKVHSSHIAEAKKPTAKKGSKN